MSAIVRDCCWSCSVAARDYTMQPARMCWCMVACHSPANTAQDKPHLALYDAVQVVVPPVEPHDPADGICVSPATTVVALPQPEQGFHSCGGFQLLSPQPSKPLEADRPELFEVIAPAAEAVAVGCYELGWQVLQPGEVAAARPSSARQPGQQQLRLFTGTVVMPRAERCFVAVQLVDHGQQGQGEPISNCRSRWLPVISLQVLPQVDHLSIHLAVTCMHYC